MNKTLRYVLTLALAISALTACYAAARSSRAPGWIGVVIRDADKNSSAKGTQDRESGALIIEIVDDSPADSAGLKEHDVVIRFGEKTISTADELRAAVRQSRPGDRVPVAVLRKGSKVALTVTIGHREEQTQRASRFETPMSGFWGFGEERIDGLKLHPLTSQLAEYFAVPGGKGLLVEDVEEGTAAHDAGFLAGDVLVKAGKHSLESTRSFIRELQRYDAGDTIDVQVIRKGKSAVLSYVKQDDTEDWDGMRMFMHRPFIRHHDADDDCE